MKTHVEITGYLLVLLGLLHLIFPTYFKWKDTLSTLPRISREIMYVHTFFIGLAVFLMGLLCITSNAELVSTDFGKKICLGLGIFWVIRLFIQFFGYSPELWRGKQFETFVHVVFSCLWTYLSVVFLGVVLFKESNPTP